MGLAMSMQKNQPFGVMLFIGQGEGREVGADHKVEVKCEGDHQLLNTARNIPYVVQMCVVYIHTLLFISYKKSCTIFNVLDLCLVALFRTLLSLGENLCLIGLFQWAQIPTWVTSTCFGQDMCWALCMEFYIAIVFSASVGKFSSAKILSCKHCASLLDSLTFAFSWKGGRKSVFPKSCLKSQKKALSLIHAAYEMTSQCNQK